MRLLESHGLKFIFNGPLAAGNLDFTVPVTAALVMLFFCLLTYKRVIYMARTSRARLLRGSNSYDNSTNVSPNSHGKVPQSKYMKSVRTFRSFFKDLLPLEFRYITTNRILNIKMKQKHDLLSLMSQFPSPKDELSEMSLNNGVGRVEGWLGSLSAILNYLLISVLLALFLYEDAGSCSNKTNSDSCLRSSISGSTVLYSYVNLCNWSKDEEKCETASANRILRAVCTLGFAAAVVVSLCNKATRFLLSHCRCAYQKGQLNWLIDGIIGNTMSIIGKCIGLRRNYEVAGDGSSVNYTDSRIAASKVYPFSNGAEDVEINRPQRAKPAIGSKDVILSRNAGITIFDRAQLSSTTTAKSVSPHRLGGNRQRSSQGNTDAVDGELKQNRDLEAAFQLSASLSSKKNNNNKTNRNNNNSSSSNKHDSAAVVAITNGTSTVMTSATRSPTQHHMPSSPVPSPPTAANADDNNNDDDQGFFYYHDYSESLYNGGAAGKLMPLQDIGDEWQSLAVQSRRNTILRAARLATMRTSMDYVSVEQELKNMMQHPDKNFWLESTDKHFHGSNWFNALRAWFITRQMYWFDFADPNHLVDLMHHAHIYDPVLIINRLRRSRQRTVTLRTELTNLQRELYELQLLSHTHATAGTTLPVAAVAAVTLQGEPDGETAMALTAAASAISVDDALDRHLVRRFIVESLYGYKRMVADRVIFQPAQIASQRQKRTYWHRSAVALLPLYTLFALFVTFYWSLAINSAIAWLWLGSFIFMLIVEYLWIQPVKIWLLHVWIPGLAKPDVMALHWVLQTRARSILRRSQGLIGPNSGLNSLTQHFHPCCRVARLMPYLPVSRLLMTLSDFDVPAAPVLRRPRRRDIVYFLEPIFNTGSPLVSDFCSSFAANFYTLWLRSYKLVLYCIMSMLRLLLHGFIWLLPRWAQEFVIEAAASAALFAFLLLIYRVNLAAPSGSLAAAVVLVLLVGVAYWIFKIRDAARREQVIFGRLRMQKFFRTSKSGTSYVSVMQNRELAELLKREAQSGNLSMAEKSRRNALMAATSAAAAATVAERRLTRGSSRQGAGAV